MPGSPDSPLRVQVTLHEVKEQKLALSTVSVDNLKADIACLQKRNASLTGSHRATFTECLQLRQQRAEVQRRIDRGQVRSSIQDILPHYGIITEGKANTTSLRKDVCSIITRVQIFTSSNQPPACSPADLDPRPGYALSKQYCLRTEVPH